MRDSWRYFGDVSRDAHDPRACDLTVGQYLSLRGYSSDYVDLVFLPLYRYDLIIIHTCYSAKCSATWYQHQGLG
jgi:hypothetical protein